MKKLISICLLVFLTVLSNAQENNKPKLNELNLDQLNLELTKSLKKIKAAKIWTGVGAGLGITGGLLLHYGSQQSGWDGMGPSVSGGFIMAFGLVSVGLAIPTWIRGSKRKKAIELELVKFNPPGSASINGIGLKIRF